MHGLLKIDGIKNFHPVTALKKGISNLIDYCALGSGSR